MAKCGCNVRIRKSVTIAVLAVFVLALCSPVLAFAVESNKTHQTHQTHQENIPCRALICQVCPCSAYPAQFCDTNSFTTVFKADIAYKEQFHIENSIRSIFKPPKV
ncbi:MAG: hypothetical protein FWG71_02780 [Synergistaceae bacterium]|nr:hypothetical protein [Synergistaceae bacterium]